MVPVRTSSPARARARPRLVRGDGTPVAWGSVETPLGAIHAATSRPGLLAVSLPNASRDAFLERVRALAGDAPVSDAPTPLLRRALRQIAEYAAGRRDRFDLPLDLRGTPFEVRVLLALATVPFGETCSYGALAARADSPRAARAVGMALARNPVPLVLACHRVVASDGSIGGFAGKERAVGVKQQLLRLEAAVHGEI